MRKCFAILAAVALLALPGCATVKDIGRQLVPDVDVVHDKANGVVNVDADVTVPYGYVLDSLCVPEELASIPVVGVGLDLLFGACEGEA